MPFKTEILPLLDSLDEISTKVGAVNTVVQEKGHLKGFNTDYLAARKVISAAKISTDAPTYVLGSGGMARSVAWALRDLGFSNFAIAGRNHKAAQGLAQDVGAKSIGVEQIKGDDAFLINATPIGMNSGEIPFSDEMFQKSKWICDVVASPAETALLTKAKTSGIKTISGELIQMHQGIEQFYLYTGVLPKLEDAQKALQFAQGKIEK